MRLTSLTLENYGIFPSQRIAFDPAPGRINLLIAPNGAGKSILRNAFCDLLFGIHGQTPMGFRYGYGRMRLLAEALATDGTPLTFGRRKGHGNTLVAADGAPIEANVLATILGHTDRTLAERLFALDTERLREGGRELLASNGSIADALLSAAGGLRQAKQTHQSLLAARDALAPLRRSQGRPFYQSLDRMLEARTRLAAAVLKPETRERQDTDLRHLRAEQERCNKLAHAASQRIARLERIRRVAGVLAEHDAAVAWLEAHADAPSLPADTGDRLAKARDDLERTEQFLERERRNREPVAEQLGRVQFDVALIAQGEAIDRLIDQAGAARQALLDMPKREAELALKIDAIAGILRQLGSPLPTDRAAEAIPPRATVLHARRLVAEHGKLRAALAQLPGELAQAEKDLAATEAAIAELPAVADMRGLARLARDIRSGGDPERREQELMRVVAGRRAKLDTAVARVRGWSAGAAALIALPVMPAETYDRLHAAFATAETALGAAAREATEAHAELDAARERLQEVAGGQPIPDEAAIAAARQHRDQGWCLIYRRAFTSEPADAALEAEWAGKQPLPLAFERSVAVADDVADRRNREGERLAHAGEVARQIVTLETRLAAAETAREAAGIQHERARESWQAACAAVGMAPDVSIAEVRALLTGRDRVMDADGEFATSARDLAALVQHHAALADRLAAELQTRLEDRRGLPDLLAHAEERIDANQKAEEARSRLHDRRVMQRAALDDKAARLRAVEAGLADLLAEWAQVRATLQRPDTEDPAVTVELLELLNALDSEQRAATQLRIRLREMQEGIAAFRSAAAELAARLTPDMAAADAFLAVQALRDRLTEHRALAGRHEALAAELKRTDTALARQQKLRDACRIELATVLALIGSDSVEAARARVALAVQRGRMEDTVRRNERALHESGDGLGLAELRREVASILADEIPGAVESARSDHDAANRGAQELAARAATMSAEMDRQAQDDAATEAAADQQAAVAALQRVTEEATLMHLAALLLDAALIRVELEGRSSLLARIAALFRTITGGGYAQLSVEEQPDGSAELIAVHHAWPDERKHVADLSEGERDQLFLALRLAAIEDHVATAPPLPFICDDILQTFDDERAAAAIGALVEVSSKVQVILLSHHRHLATLCERLPPECVHLCAVREAVPA